MKKNGRYVFYQYKDFYASFNRKTGTACISDALAERMLQDGLISIQTFNTYTKYVQQLFTPPERIDTLRKDQINVLIQRERRSWLSIEALEKERALKWERGCSFDITEGIDQKKKKQTLLEQADTVYFMLCQDEMFSIMLQNIENIQKTDRKIKIIVSDTLGWNVPDKGTLQKVLKDMNDEDYYEITENTVEEMVRVLQKDKEERRLLLVYGEDGFLLCRNLSVETIVHGIPTGYCTRALTNQFGKNSACVVYVPPFFDITSWVPLTERTRLSFWQLYRLWVKYGDIIYQYSPIQLYKKYPQQFFNIYDTKVQCIEDEENYPITISWPCKGKDISSSSNESTDSHQDNVFWGTYDYLREQAISQYLNAQKNLRYFSRYFNEELQAEEIPWNCTCAQKGIMVQGVRITRVKEAQIITCEEGISPREVLHDDDLHLISNFLFFFTPPLAKIYNEIRKERPREQIALPKIHLDYMLCQKDGERIETFPLFEKACIAKKSNGQFLFFNYRLGGGRIRIKDTIIRWRDTDINVPDGMVYTPDYSRQDEGADVQTFCKFVGANRFNLVIIQNRIHCIRKGDVILPSVGVVVSLDKELEERFLDENKLLPLEDGYYDCSELSLEIELDGPDQIPLKEWQQVEWAYGGGMALILDGKGLDTVMPRSIINHASHRDSIEAAEEWFRKEGWMSPLSRQTQESAMHNLCKHPRTAIGVTWDNELVILVFSGRIRISSGADYYEMCRIARELVPDIRCLMNVDGGGSAVLGMVLNGSFVELSCPASATGSSCVGMVRSIKTILHLRI